MLVLAACDARTPQKDKEPAASELQTAIDQTMAEARRAIAVLGETEPAMQKIQKALAELAKVPGLRARARLSELHGSSSMRAGKLASDGDDEISLFVVHFAANTSTPPHDHLTWGVLHVLEGRDLYVAWPPVSAGTDPLRAGVRRGSQVELGPGDSVYWLSPPHDVHSQQAKDADVWEVVMTGKNTLAEGVTRHRHYFDPETGRVADAASR